MSIIYSQLPIDSNLANFIQPNDFVDCVYGAKNPPRLSASKATYVTMAHMPAWIRYLMKLRNLIVGPLGLKTGKGQSFDQAAPQNFEAGGRMGVFKVQSVCENEIILGDDDKHLNFRVAIIIRSDGYYLATWVRTHNIWGKIYLKTIMPFHRLITQASMKRLLLADAQFK